MAVWLTDMVHNLASLFAESGTVFVVAFACFLAGELLLKQIARLRDDRNLRYFILHVSCNFYVTIVHLDDVFVSYAYPLNSWRETTDNRGCFVIYALHLFHIVFHFSTLTAVDWVHHIVMIVVMLPLAVGLNPGALLGHGAFFSSGFPGGIDYLNLVLVKLGLMRSMTQKRINCLVQTWIRAPGCLYHALFAWIGYRADDYLMKNAYLPTSLIVPALLVVMSSFYWNGLYFQTRVVANYAVKITEAKSDSRDQ